MDFGNVHRFSHKPRGKRPIVARFIHFNDSQYVLNNAYRLRNTPCGIRQQFPREIEDRRRELNPIQKEAKRQGKRVALIRDRLYMENELYVPRGGFRGGRAGRAPPKIRKAYVIQR